MGRRRARRRGARTGRRRGRRRTTRRVQRRRRMRRRRRRRVVLMGGMIALGSAAVYKLSKKDVQQVEEYTGKTAEELSDEELQAAIDDLQLQVDELSDAEYDEVEKADAIDDDPAPAAAAPAAPTQSDYIAELKQLAELKDAGIVSEEEFESKKKQLLGL